MIAEQAHGFSLAHHLAIDGEDVVGLDPDGRGRQGPAIDGDPPLGNQPLHLAARGHSGPGQGLGDSLAAALRGLTFAAAGGS